MSGATVQSTRLRKVECECGCIIRMSRAAMLRSGLPTCGCGSAMYPSEPELAAECGDDVLDRHPLMLAHAITETLKAERDARRGGDGGRKQCGGCRRFVAKVNETCACGFTNDIRGRRNHGGYLGLLPDRAHNHHIPF